MKMKSFITGVGLLIAGAMSFGLAGDAAHYSNDFEHAAAGKPGDEFMILAGNFSVVKVEGNACLELTPTPIDGYGMLFGPAGQTSTTVSARIYATPTGRRFPEFGIGAGDAGGYRLIVTPATASIELRRGEEVKASAHYDWTPGSWTHLKIHISKDASGAWEIDGKAWPEKAAEPAAWLVSTKETGELPAGRASIWGMPYSETPIRFDDLQVDP